MRRALLIAAVALAAAAAGFAVHRLWGGAQVDPASSAKLMSLALPDAEGHVQPMAQWRGKVIVANFWATWCPPCREEIPAFVRVSKKYTERGVQFVGISIDSPDKVREFAREYAVSYPLLIGSFEPLELTQAMGNRAQALPFTAILDRSGAAHFVKLGTLSESALESVLQELQ